MLTLYLILLLTAEGTLGTRNLTTWSTRLMEVWKRTTNTSLPNQTCQNTALCWYRASPAEGGWLYPWSRHVSDV